MIGENRAIPLRITLHTDYALRVLLYLAPRPGERVATETIATSHGVSLNHLQKVVRSLGELGYVALHRGAGGGVELKMDPKDISVGAVVRSLDDATSLVECFRADTNECVIASACSLKGALGEAQEAFYATLDPVTLASLIRGKRGKDLRSATG